MPEILEKTPMCEVTGMPLPILPKGPDEVRALCDSIGRSYTPYQTDEHHHIHPKKIYTAQGVAGRALRDCRIQYSDYNLHHQFYHPALSGPEVSFEESQAFEFIVPAVAKVIPREAIDFLPGGEWRRTVMNDVQYAQVARSIGIAQIKNIGRFFAEYAAKQDIPGIINDDSKIDEFLDNRTSAVRKQEIARAMLAGAVTLSLEDASLIDKYEEYKDQGLIATEKPRTFGWVTRKFVRLGHLQHFQHIVGNQLVTA